MANIFEISKEDKENFIQALHSIFNLDRNYPDEEREFIYQLKILMGLNNFKPYTLDNEEKDLAALINKIKNKDLIYYLFLITEEVEGKQRDRTLYKRKIEGVVERLSPEIKNIINSKSILLHIIKNGSKNQKIIEKKETIDKAFKKAKSFFNELLN